MGNDKNGGRGRSWRNLSMQSRRVAVLAILGRIQELTQQATDAVDPVRKKVITDELGHMRALQRSLSVTSGPVEPACLPKRYNDKRRAANDAAAVLSGRKTMSARFVQGGSPGGGKKT